MEKNEIYDLHCHFLPGVDDGCKTAEEAIQVLIKSQEQGVTGIAATPHYYPRETVDQFLRRREKAFEELQILMKKNKRSFPEICLGAEVYFHTGMIYEEQLKKLCYGESQYLLLEMPFSRWTSGVLREVYSIRSVKGITPVIAHLERYFKLAGREAIDELLNMDVIVQMNAEYVQGFWTRRRAKKMLESGMVQIIGSDCHNLTNRPPNMGSAIQFLIDSGMDHELNNMNRISSKIFREARKVRR